MKERTTSYVQLTLRGKTGAPETPTSVYYRIDCLTTGLNVRAPTALPPLGEQELILTAPDTSIINRDNVAEMKRITVVATYGLSDDSLTAEFDYQVQRAQYAL